MLSKELDLPTSQLLGLFNTLIRKTSAALRGVHEKSIEKTLSVVKSTPLSTSANGTLMPLDEELEEAAKELKKKQKEERKDEAPKTFKDRITSLGMLGNPIKLSLINLVSSLTAM